MGYEWIPCLLALALGVTMTFAGWRRLGAARSMILLIVWGLAADRVASQPRFVANTAAAGLARLLDCLAELLMNLWPFWLLVVGSALITVQRYRDDKALKAPVYRCACGYDLHGNSSGVCPECGRAVGGDRVDAGEARPEI